MIGLLGSGSWATAIVKILLEKKDRRINWWVREEEIIPEMIEGKHNPLYLSEAYIDTSRINISSDIMEVITKSDDIYLVVPSAFVDRALREVPKEIMQQKRIISAVKGIVPEHTTIITEYLREQFGMDYSQLCIISGPSHAEEAAQQKLTYLTVASTEKRFAEDVERQIGCNYIKTTYSSDMSGIECAAVLKNIYAIAAGMCRGIGYGDNIIAVLISNALQEMTDFMQIISPMIGEGDFNADARLRQFESFAYLGDLLVTSYSQFSRNRTFGNMLGRGYSVKAAQLEMKMVAEGYYATEGVKKIIDSLNHRMPIVEAVYAILYEKKPINRTIKKLLENLH